MSVRAATSSYRSFRRTGDRFTGVVHLKDVLDMRLSLCGAGFSASSLNMDVKHADVPTCVFCIAGMSAGLPYWTTLPTDDVYRRAVEENLASE